MSRERKNNLFKELPAPRVSRNLFDLSHEVKMSGKFGYLYPVLCLETLPGDRIRDTMNAMIRFAPLLAPIMHRVDVTTHFFFVPNRIIWANWEEFITGGEDGLSSPIPPYVTPFSLASGQGEEGVMKRGSLWDYLGLPTIEDSVAPVGGWSNQKVSDLPFRACAKVWNDFYRDPNLHEEMEIQFDQDGAMVGTHPRMLLKNYRRGFEKDYFTSALPWAQRGAQVLLPMSVRVDEARIAVGGAVPGAAGFVKHDNLGDLISDYGSSPIYLQGDNAETTVNDFRRALAIQRWLENNARGGARYVEQIEGHFDERVPDYRLQRAEYIGGGRQAVQISEVLATAENSVDGVTVGDMKGHGLSVGRTNTFTYRCREHGFVIGFMSVTMRTAYSQGLPRMFTREDKFDYAFPELANLGEQEIKSKEVFYSFAADDDDDNELTFGYIPRYAEYKFQNDRISGDFKGSLGFWHLGRKFTQRPSLDANFTTIDENGGGNGDAFEETFRRIFAVTDGTDYLWMQLYHNLTAKRPLPYFGVPSL